MPRTRTLKPKVCPVCREQFQPYSSKQKYCSRDCFAVTRYKLKPKPCEKCGEPFVSYQKTQRFCSSTCGRNARTIFHKRPCPECGKEFKPHRHEQVTCSQKCRWTHSRRTKAEQLATQKCELCKEPLTSRSSVRFCSTKCANKSRRTLSPIKCKHCDKEFRPRVSSVKYCSQQCSTEARSKTLRETRECVECGEKFGPVRKSHKKKYCSKKCRYAGIRKDKRRDCEECGKTFSPKNKATRFCSTECSGKNRRTFEATRTCPQCDKEFQVDASYRERKFCGKACADAALKTKKEISCEQCGEQFFPPNKKSRFCSMACFSESTRRIQPIPCGFCEEVFTPTQSGMKCCSPQCSGKLKRKVQKPCLQCKAPVKVKRQKFCSNECFKKFSRKRNAGRVLKCFFCDEEFVPTSNIAKFCSRKCAAREANIRHRYGLDGEGFRELWEEQDGKCGGCEKEFPNKFRACHVDHSEDEEWVYVEGLLCGLCNTGIGQLGHDPERMRRLADYCEGRQA